MHIQQNDFLSVRYAASNKNKLENLNFLSNFYLVLKGVGRKISRRGGGNEKKDRKIAKKYRKLHY